MAGPKINDDFWFTKSEEIVNNSLKRLDAGLENLNKYFTALWAIYIVASIFTIEYLEFTKPQYYFAIVAPHILLFLGRWASLAGQLPKTIEFAYNVPQEIEDAYTTTYNHKRTYLSLGNFISVLATVAIVFALIFSFKANNNFKNKKYETEQEKTKKEQKIKNRVVPNLQAQLNKEKNVIIYIVENKPNTTVQIQLLPNGKESLEPDYNKEQICSSKGIIHGEFKIVTKNYNTLELRVHWIEDENEKIEKTITRKITLITK